MQAALGLVFFLGVCWLLSEARQRIEWRTVVVGLLIQFALAYLFLKVTWVANALGTLNSLIAAVEQATLAGTVFLFGYLGGGDSPFQVDRENAMYLFAFRVLPQVVVFSAIIAILWYWRVLPAIVRAFGWLLRRGLQISGVLGTSGAASLFLGMVETPLVIRGYLATLSRSEFFTVMTFGMATVAGSVMVLYAGVLSNVYDGVVGHILAASLLNVIGAIYVAHLMIPPSREDTSDVDQTRVSLRYESFMDALTRGTSDGLTLAMNVGAMLLVFISLVALVNGILGTVSTALDLSSAMTLQDALGWLFAPVAWLIGIPWAEAQTAGGLLGTKLVLNELVAFLQLAESATDLSQASRLIMIYALCGFANFGSLGILLGGLTTLVPERRKEYLEIAPKSLISGTIVTLMTGGIVALVSRL